MNLLIKLREAIRLLALPLALLIGSTQVAAQEPGMLNVPTVVSPVVAEDGSVTFSLYAPEAKSVVVMGDFGSDTALAKGEDGVWQATIGPLPPEMYVYYFMVDGMRMPDPANPQVKIGYVITTTVSLVTVPAAEPEFYAVQNVPHGEVRTIGYYSNSNEVNRELVAYVPPGYDENPDQRYPVLYLLHGFANDHHSWQRYGRANEILDNMLARGEIDPFIVVMPLGYGGAAVNGDGNGLPAETAGTRFGGFNLYERDILEDVIPMIDANFRTKADRENRAIMGFSMGGAQAGRFGLRNLDTFSHVGIMSAGLFQEGDTAIIDALAADPEGTNEKLNLLWIASGVDDEIAITRSRELSAKLEEIGIDHTFVETEGAHHWRVWRRYLHEVAPLLFKK